jgi:hypothetical protein
MISIPFVDFLYMFVMLFRSLPLNMLGGLAMPTHRPSDLRDPVFILRYIPLPLDMLGGLALPI